MKDTMVDFRSATVFKELLCKVSGGMGRDNIGERPTDDGAKLYDREVPLNQGGYDSGGAYWGIGAELRVEFTIDKSYVRFYRK